MDDDGDGYPDDCDSCPGGNDALDADGDGIADACDVCDEGDDLIDSDVDEVPNACDNCPTTANRSQADSDYGAELTRLPFYWRATPTAFHSLTLANEAVSAPVSLGFTYDYFDRPYTQVRVHANGYLLFGTGVPSGDGIFRSIPAATGGADASSSTAGAAPRFIRARRDSAA